MRGVKLAGNSGLMRRSRSCRRVSSEPAARRERTGPPPKRALEMPRVSPGCPECLSKAPECGAACTAGPGPGDWDPQTRRSAARRVRGPTDRSRVGWTSGRTHALGSSAGKDRCRPLQRPCVKALLSRTVCSWASATEHNAVSRQGWRSVNHLGSSRHLATARPLCGRPPPRQGRAEHDRRGSETGALATRTCRPRLARALTDQLHAARQRPPGGNSGPTRSFAEHQAAKITP
jgi:hypothetical protein